MKFKTTTKMFRVSMLLVLGLVTCIVIARNVESNKEKTVEENDEEIRNKRSEVDNFLYREWDEYLKGQKLAHVFKEQQKMAVAEFLAEKKKKFEEFTGKGQCRCHRFKRDGEDVEICVPDNCKTDEQAA